MSTQAATTSTHPTAAGSAPSSLFRSLLRPSILHILRAAGFHSTKSSVLDTVVDLAARYLTLLATSTAAHAEIPSAPPTLVDVRLALQECGAFRPQLNMAEEWAWGDDEDARGMEAFVEWVLGDGNREIRRVAGMKDMSGTTPSVGTGAKAKGSTNAGKLDAVHQAEELLQEGGQEDFLTILRKKHSKTGEESRFQGTVLGKSMDDRPIRIEGGPVGSIDEWATAQMQNSLAGAEGAAEAAALKRLTKAKEDERDGQDGDQVMTGN